MTKFSVAQSYPNADYLVYPADNSQMGYLFRCFYTKVYVSKGFSNDFYARSKEHLISQSSIFYSKIKEESRSKNLVYASKWVNSFVGNIPLAAKLYLRSRIEYTEEMQTDSDILKKVFMKAWGETDKKFDLFGYRGRTPDVDKLFYAQWDQYFAENKMTDYGLKYNLEFYDG